MTEEKQRELDALLARISEDEKICEKIASFQSGAELKALLSEYSIELTEEESNALLMALTEDELSEEALESAAGGRAVVIAFCFGVGVGLAHGAIKNLQNALKK